MPDSKSRYKNKWTFVILEHNTSCKRVRVKIFKNDKIFKITFYEQDTFDNIAKQVRKEAEVYEKNNYIEENIASKIGIVTELT